jgi:biotin carboxylase
MFTHKDAADTLLTFAAKYPLLRRLHDSGINLINFQDPRFLDKQAVSVCESTHFVNLERIEQLVSLSRSLCLDRRVIGAYSQNELGLSAAASVNEAFGFSVRFNKPQAVLNTRNKLRLRELIGFGHDGNSSGSLWRACSNAAALRAFVDEIGSRFDGIVVKPIAGVGSLGVKQLRNVEEISTVVFPREGLLAEAFIHGNQYSVETFTFNGEHRLICVNREINADSLAPNGFVQIGHMLPIHFDEQLLSSVTRVVFDALNMVGVEHGPCHTEIVLHDSEIYIIEINTRNGSSPLPEMIRLVTGVDVYGLSIDWFMKNGASLRFQIATDVAAAVRHFTPPAGRVKAIHGVERALALNGVKAISIKVRPGDIISPIYSAFDRIGYVIATGHSAESAFQCCSNAAGLIKFVLED